ncbi:MAG TPA: methyl-accepting chemotaxis protein, partial [Verrucomicrobiales bacterium]|nr:methyl-accepting chemotaxis protein [Verrucomicrobiales bacterium]
MNETIHEVLKYRCIRAKIIFCAALPITLSLVILSGFMSSRVYRTLKESAFLEIGHAIKGVAVEINQRNLEAAMVPRIMALAQVHGLFGKRQESIAYAKHVLETHPHLTGAYFGYEPNADKQDASFPPLATEEEAKAMDANGRFLPYFFRDKNNSQLIKLTPLVDMEKNFYYQGVKNRVEGRLETEQIALAPQLSRHYVASALGDIPDERDQRIMITEPYIYEGKMIYEQTYPIILDDQFVGIAGVDRALTDVHNELNSAKPFNTAEFILISKRGRIISATFDTSLKGAPVENTLFSKTLLPLYQNRAQDVEMVKDDNDNKKYLYQSVKIPYGKWTLIMRVNHEEIFGPLRKTIFWRLCMVLAVVIGIFSVLIWIANDISCRIYRACELASRVAKGDLTGKVEIQGTDETGQLLSDIQKMIQNLNRLIGQVKSSSIELTSTATRISAGAKSQKTAVQDFGSSTSQIAAAVKEISATSQELSKTMMGVRGTADENADLAESGRTNLDEMQKAMNRLVDANQSISGKLSVINNKAQNINSVVTTINKVADQTNLLSLNAAIEAEKAGEFGQGFSVVAREIRRLADQTAVATLDIEKMVQEMQTSVSAGVMEMDKFSEQIRMGVDEVGSISKQLGQIIGNVQLLSGKFESVQQGMVSQTEGAQQISEAMTQLNQSAKSSSNSIQSFNQATTDLHKSVGDLRQEI